MKGNHDIAQPTRTIVMPRVNACRARVGREAPRSIRFDIEKTPAVPTMKRKNGKMRSVGVQPCHSAWSNGQ